MTIRIKDQILVTNPKAIKILKKDFTKRILKCFNEEPKTASQIANSISFPKDKIYYHIKNLISLDILFIAEKTMVKGIEQKSFLPTAKKFSIDEINEKSFNDEYDNLRNIVSLKVMFPPKSKLNLKMTFHLEKLMIEEGISIVESWLDGDPIMIGGY